MKKIEIPIQGGQVLVAVRDGAELVLRIQKNGHNRGIAKLAPEAMAQLAELLK